LIEGTVPELQTPEPIEFELECSVSVMVIRCGICGISSEVVPIETPGKTAAFEKLSVFTSDETAFTECTIFAELVCAFEATVAEVNPTGTPTGFEVTVSDAITVA
jgi:hypothetical protein